MKLQNTYGGLHDFGRVAIMATTIPTIATISARNTKNVHFLINGQFQCTNPGISFVTAIPKLAA